VKEEAVHFMADRRQRESREKTGGRESREKKAPKHMLLVIYH
jgi:hypothetical protein